MNIFELGVVALPVIGTVVGVKHHATLGVSSFVGGLTGLAVGIAIYFVGIFILAAVLSLISGKPMFRPKKERKVDDA